jgi:hypothetical protein
MTRRLAQAPGEKPGLKTTFPGLVLDLLGVLLLVVEAATT